MPEADPAFTTWTLIVFIGSVIFVLFPQKLSLPPRCLFPQRNYYTITIDFAVAPTVGVLLLLATRTLPLERFYASLAGDELVRPWQVLLASAHARTLC